MANAIEKIRNGIIKTDWGLICSAYKDLTGEVLEPPNSNADHYRNTINKIKEICLSYDSQEPFVSEQQPRKQKKKTIPKPPPPPENETTTNGEPIPPQSNKTNIFGNKTNFITEEVSDEEIKETRKNFKQKEHRPPVTMYDIICCICDNPFKSFIPSSDEIGQRCGKCLKDTIKNAK